MIFIISLIAIPGIICFKSDSVLNNKYGNEKKKYLEVENTQKSIQTEEDYK
jgi:hypothetical protein